MPSSLEQAQTLTLAFVDALLTGQSVTERAIPDVQTLDRNSLGAITPYVCMQFGDSQPKGSTSFVGPMGDDYVLPIYIQIIAGNMSDAQKISNKTLFGFLGQSFPWAGQVEKRVSGAVFPILNSDGATEAYMAPLSFGLPINLNPSV